jgi:adenylate cyclase
MLQLLASPSDRLTSRTAAGARTGLGALGFRLGLLEYKIRIISGLILFAFAGSHFTNHAFGIFRLGTIETMRHVIMWPWNGIAGQLILLTALISHAGLGVSTFYRRRHFRIPWTDRVQLVLGLAVPLLLIPHAVNVRAAELLFGLPISYLRVLFQIWIASPVHTIIQQYILLLFVWIHGCIGIHKWLRFRRFYVRAFPFIVASASLLPALAIIGIADAGWAVQDAIARDSGVRARIPTLTPSQTSELARLTWWLLGSYLGLLGAVLLLRLSRDWYGRRFRPIRVRFGSTTEIVIPRGLTLLEASRRAGLPHAAVCGGRGRCSTCRVLVLAGAEHLPPPEAMEQSTLERIGAKGHVRLACQMRPTHDIDALPLVPSNLGRYEAAAMASQVAREQEIAAIFVDLRDSTKLANERLPYDALYILERYVSVVRRAIARNRGAVTSVAGDGIVAFFGGDCDARTACRRAVKSIYEIWSDIGNLNALLESTFSFHLAFGAGCHAGIAVVTPAMPDFAGQFLGEVGNVASRLEGLTKLLQCTTVISRQVAEVGNLPVPSEAFSTHELRGIALGVEVAGFTASEQLGLLFGIQQSVEKR